MAAIKRSHRLAAAWGSPFVDAGAQGHLDAASGIGRWSEGHDLLERLIGASIGRAGSVRSLGDVHAALATGSEDARSHALGA